MATLLCCPIEVITHIVEALHPPPRHILAFALSCHCALAAAKGSLEKHKKLATFYKRTASHRNDCSAPCIKLPDLFEKLYSDEAIAYHIRSISFAFDDDTLEVDIAEAMRSAIDELHFGSVDQKEQWKKRLEDGKIDIVAGLVLLRLRRPVLLEWRSRAYEEHSGFLDLVGAAVRNQGFPPLHTLVLRHDKSSGGDISLDALSPFLGIESLRNITTKNCYSLNGSMEASFDSSQVEDLKISLCMGNNTLMKLNMFLEYLPALQRLSLKQPCMCDDFDTLQFCRDLAERAPQLMMLTLLSGQSSYGHQAGDFSMFPNLEVVKSHFHLVMPRTSQLQPLMPSSLKHLHLVQHGDTDLEDYLEQIYQLTTPDSQRAWNLERLDLTCQRDGIGKWESYSGEVGKIEVRVFFQVHEIDQESP